MGDDNQIDKDALLEKAKALVLTLEQGDTTDEVIETSLDEIMTLRETSLFHELGKMTRDIHDSIMNFRMDSRISDLASTDIPDAFNRGAEGHFTRARPESHCGCRGRRT